MSYPTPEQFARAQSELRRPMDVVEDDARKAELFEHISHLAFYIWEDSVQRGAEQNSHDCWFAASCMVSAQSVGSMLDEA